MKTILALALFVFLPTVHAITYKGARGIICANASLTCTAGSASPLDLEAGDTIVAFVNAGTATAGTVTDSCGNVWQRYSTPTVPAPWLMLHAKAQESCSVTVERTSQPGPMMILVAHYSGVAEAGQVTDYSNTVQGGTTCEVNITTSNGESGRFIVGGFFFNRGINQGLTLQDRDGTNRRQVNMGASTAMSLADSGASPPQAATIIGFTPSSNPPIATCTRQGLELRAQGATGAVAKLTDQTQTVLLNGTTGGDYTLPHDLLSLTWCTWVMPRGPNTNTYHIAVTPPAKLNNQTDAMHLPSWQMTRICEDAHSNYWAPPPIVQGTGITVTSSPTAITVSANTQTLARETEVQQLQERIRDLEKEVHTLEQQLHNGSH